MKRFVLVALFILSIVAFSTTRVLILYVSQYDDKTIVPLPNTQKDAENISNAFKSLPGVIVTVVSDPTYGEFIKAVRNWAKSAEDDDTLVFYYSGHGMVKDGEFYFIPKDADPQDEYTWVAFSRIKKYIP